MRLVLRIIGTWLVGLALIFIVIDGTRSLAANAISITPIAQTWMGLHPQSIDLVRAFFASRLFAPLLDQAFTAFLDFPTFAVLGVPGILLALAGRTRSRRRYLRQDQI